MKNLKWIIPLVLIAIVAVVYLWPVPRIPFDQVYTKVDSAKVQSLHDFRTQHPPKTINVNGVTWEYVSLGTGDRTILFLHGMTGAYDIWWQELEALKSDYRVIAVTYPAVNSLAEMESGVMSILDAEGVDKFSVVGTSLGGYFAQYLVARHADRIEAAVFANTFPPNDLIANENKTIGAALPFLPEWLVIKVLRDSFLNSLYPASGDDELTLAFLNEISYGRMRKSQVVGRFHCVVEKFDAPNPQMPLMIIESDNDPLVAMELREQLKQQYPNAVVHTLHKAGHMPYINRPDEYTQFLRQLFK